MGKIYDLIIIGAGPAGITAGIYAARKRMDFLIISKDIGGQTTWSGDIENYTGYQFISGPDLVAKFEKHIKKYGIKVNQNEAVQEIKKEGQNFKVLTDEGEYRAKTLVIASGKSSKELTVPGEKEFKNKGLTYCATCDAPLFSGKDVAVIGGGNSGLDATLQLIKIAKKIYLINIDPELSGDAIMQEKVKRGNKVAVLNNTKVTAVMGDKMLNAIKIETQGQEEKLDVQGVFVEIGLIPNSGFIKDIAKNEKGEISVDCRSRTNVPGVFAAGDVTDIPEKQIIIAAGEGSKAALGAFRYLSQSR